MSGEAKAATFRINVDKILNNEERCGISKGSVGEIAGAVTQRLLGHCLLPCCHPPLPLADPRSVPPAVSWAGWAVGSPGKLRESPGRGGKALFTTAAGPVTRLCPAPGSCVFLH